MFLQGDALPGLEVLQESVGRGCEGPSPVLRQRLPGEESGSGDTPCHHHRREHAFLFPAQVSRSGSGKERPWLFAGLSMYSTIRSWMNAR